MVNTCFTGIEIEHLAEVGPAGANGKEVLTCLMYDNVIPAARLSRWDCALDSLIDRLDMVYFTSFYSNLRKQTLLTGHRLPPPRLVGATS